jgi:hypothetical protein
MRELQIEVAALRKTHIRELALYLQATSRVPQIAMYQVHINKPSFGGEFSVPRKETLTMTMILFGGEYFPVLPMVLAYC